MKNCGMIPVGDGVLGTMFLILTYFQGSLISFANGIYFLILSSSFSIVFFLLIWQYQSRM